MQVNRKELCYEIFFILMIAAKGLGLDSGDKLYYILSALAAAAAAGKLLTTEYNRKELAAMTLLGVIALLAYRNSGRLGIVLSVLAVIGMKDMDIKKLFRTGLIVFGSAFALKVTGTVAGIFPNALAVHEKSGIGEVIRWGMGFSTGNVLHESYFILTAFAVYNLDRKYGIKQMLWLMAGNLLVFAFSLSYTGILVTTFYLLLSLYAAKRKQLGRAERIMAQLPLPLCLLCSFVPPFLTGTAPGDRLNVLLQARPAFSRYYLTNQPVTLFGTRMKDVPNFWIIMDNGYVYFLMTFGLVAFALFCLGYMAVIAQYSGSGRKNQEKSHRELALIYAFLIYGIMEQFISNAFMNISIFFLGEVLFAALASRGEAKKESLRLQNRGIFRKLVRWGEKPALPERPAERKSRRLREEQAEAQEHKSRQPFGAQENKSRQLSGAQEHKSRRLSGAQEHKSRRLSGAQGNKAGRRLAGGAGMVLGLIFLTVYAAAGAKKEYVSVPLTAVNQITAESVLFQLDTACEDKKSLKEEMNRCAELVKEEDFLDRVLEAAEEKGIAYWEENCGNMRELTAEKVRAMMEISIPQQNQQEQRYDTFRLRLLESCYDVPPEVYKSILEEIAALLLREGDLAAKAGDVYAETVGKSFGTDRIEHIADNESYLVEKSGNIAVAENIRQGILRYLEGMLLGSMAAAAVWLLYDRRKEKSRRGSGGTGD